jgi:hypothetical protein
MIASESEIDMLLFLIIRAVMRFLYFKGNIDVSATEIYDLSSTVHGERSPTAAHKEYFAITQFLFHQAFIGSHSWKPPILQDVELMQNAMQDH